MTFSIGFPVFPKQVSLFRFLFCSGGRVGWLGRIILLLFFFEFICLPAFVAYICLPQSFVSHKAILGDKKGDARSAANSSGQRIYNSHPAFLLQRQYEGLTGKPVWGTRTIVLDVLAGCLCISRSISVHLSLSFLLCVLDSRCICRMICRSIIY